MSYNKYYLYKKQVSNDSGQTWTDVTPLETVPSGDVIATYDTLAECESYYSSQYLTFVAEDNCTFTFTPNNSSLIYYSLNSGTTWTQGSAVTVNAETKVMWKGEMTPPASYPYGIGYFSATTGHFSVEGNIMSLLFGDNFEGQTSLEGKVGVFYAFFQGCSGLTTAENLILPATTLVDNCYEAMFKGCTSLTTAPQLPATTLAERCYEFMFQGCTSLTTAPQLPATTLESGCYGYMFRGCTALTTAPVLSATTLAEYCYCHMFRQCTSLQKAPILPATTLEESCYEYMFSGCTSLNEITCLATDKSARYCTNYWVIGVSASGTFVKAASMTSWTRGNNGIPTNWTVQNA